MTEDTVLYGGYEGTWVSMGMLRDILLAVREVDALEDDGSQKDKADNEDRQLDVDVDGFGRLR